MTVRVLVTHPGRQHSHRAALALTAAGRLAGYWSGVPSLERHRGVIPSALWRRFVRYEPVALPPELVRCAPWVPGLRRLGDRLPRALAARVDLAACRAFDRWVRRRLVRTSAGAVLACEISALETFRVAKRLGWLTLLDAPSLHHSAQDRLHGYREPEAVHRRVVAVKDAEIELADAIVTVSGLARESYLDAGIDPGKVLAIPLGADLERFGSLQRAAPTGPCRFLFVGAAIARKGFDLLVAALGPLVAAGVPFHLRLVGPRGELSDLVHGLPRENWSATGSLPQAEVAAEMAAADCLVLPSRNDSYGMVVAEAMAAGTPVVVSSMVGARDLVVEGAHGWVVPVGDVAALAARLEECARRPELLRSLSSACRARAREASWQAYGDRLLAALGPVLDRGRR